MYKLFPFCIFIFFLSTFSPASGQCEKDEFLDICSAKMSNFTFLKSFPVSVKKKDAGFERKITNSYILSKGTMYVITACSPNDDASNMVVSLLDKNRKLISSSFNKSKNKHYPLIGYKCNMTGIYYITFEFPKEGEAGCGLSILGFKKT